MREDDNPIAAFGSAEEGDEPKALHRSNFV